jgi:hypothetical protein
VQGQAAALVLTIVLPPVTKAIQAGKLAQVVNKFKGLKGFSAEAANLDRLAGAKANEVGNVLDDITKQGINLEDRLWDDIADIGDAGDLGSVSNGLRVDLLIKDAFKPGWTKQKVLQFQHGQRPHPSEYLARAHIEKHLSQFQDGVSFFCPKEAIERYGDLLGRSDGVFVISKSKMDDLVLRAQGDMNLIETELAIPKGNWASREMCRVDVKYSEDIRLRMPSGNEQGANEFFTPGGFTANGQAEAVIDPIPKGKYTYIDFK